MKTNMLTIGLVSMLCITVGRAPAAPMTTWTSCCGSFNIDRVSTPWHWQQNWDNGVPNRDVDVFIPDSIVGNYIGQPTLDHGIQGEALNLWNNGVLRIQRDASLHSQNALIGVQDAGTVHMVIGGSWINEDWLVVGYEGGGESQLNILDERTRLATRAVTIGDNPRASGKVLVDAEFEVTDELRVGYQGVGTLEITGGGRVSSTSAVIGYRSSSKGTVTVQDAGSIWTNAGSMIVGGESTQTSTLTITKGGVVRSEDTLIGASPSGRGEVIVAGTGSTWDGQSSHLVVGDHGRGSLSVSTFGSVSNGSAIIGDHQSSVGEVIVSNGGTWTNRGDLIVGHESRQPSTLTIRRGLLGRSGGKVTSVRGAIGDYPGSFGEANVSQASSWVMSSELRVGNAGSGTLNINTSGRVASNGAVVGYAPSSKGEATVDGIGAKWNNTGDMAIGGGSEQTSTLEILRGGAVTTGRGFIGYSPIASGAVTVDGDGSKWTGTGYLSIGPGHDGRLTVSNGGTVAFPQIVVEPSGRVEGNGTLIGTVTNRGAIGPEVATLLPAVQGIRSLNAPLSSPDVMPVLPLAVILGLPPEPQTLHVIGDYVQEPSGILNLAVSSPDVFSSLDVSGHMALAGTLKVSLLGDFMPQPGQVFQFLNAASFSGQFDHFDLPPLADGLSWDTSSFYGSGIVAVGPIAVPEPAGLALAVVGAVGLVRCRRRFGSFV